MTGKVLLVNMPFGGIDRPAIGISTLKAGLTARGIGCDIRYLNFEFAQMVGPKLYQWFSDSGSHMIFAGEWMFAKEFLGKELPSASSFFSYLRNERGVNEQTIQAIRNFRQSVRPFLEKCLVSVEWERYAVIGFTSTFEQNLPSIALAYALKCRYPHKVVVMGGANCEGSMGVALHRHFPFLDYVFTGASDESFPQFVEHFFNGESIKEISGIAYRDGKNSQCATPAHPVEDLNSIPKPDYDDYFAQLSDAAIARDVSIRLQIETSRGCWWGMKHHCTFCGMNAATMRFKSKSKDRVLDEISYLVERYGIRSIDAVDAILDMHYFHELLPELRDKALGLDIFYELKANLTKPQVKLLADAGVTLIQPGIESFNTRILKIMKKGATALQNVQLLKWCKQFGIEPTWNLLYGFPGELAEDYSEQLELIRSISHLAPPRGSGRLRMDRFSPHFERSKDFGFINVRPLKAYEFIYPFSRPIIFEIAYFFDYEHADGLEPATYIDPTEQELVKWRAAAVHGAALELTVSDADSIVITDSRNSNEQSLILRNWQKEVYTYCEQGRPFDAIMRMLKHTPYTPMPSEERVKNFLAEMVQNRLIARDAEWFLSLAVGLPLDESASPHGARSILTLPVLQASSLNPS